MAIAFDAASMSTDQTSSPITWNHTVGSGSNRLLIVGVALKAQTTQPTATAVTYNGVSMTLARQDQATLSGVVVETSVWILANPNTGTNQVSVTFTGGSSPHGGGTSVSYTGASQTSIADAVNGSSWTGTQGSKTFAVTTVADNSWVFAMGLNTASLDPTIVAQQTQRGTNSVGLTGTLPGRFLAEDTNTIVHPAGSQTMGFTVGADISQRGGTMSGVSFAPFVVTSTVTGVSTITGIQTITF